MSVILIDVDDVVCENHFVPVVNEYLGKNYKEEDFGNVKIELELFPDTDSRYKFYDYYVSVDSYDGIELKPGAGEVLEKLIKNNRVILVTSGCHYENSLAMGRQFGDKWRFLLNKLPFFPPQNIIFANQKDLIKGDIIVEDRVENMKGEYEKKILFTAFHNKNITDEELSQKNIIRVDDWHQLYKALNDMGIE